MGYVFYTLSMGTSFLEKSPLIVHVTPQTLAQELIMHAGMILTVSTEQRKWSVPMILVVVANARTNGSSANSMRALA